MIKYFVKSLALISFVSLINYASGQSPLQKRIESGVIEGAISRHNDQVEKYLGIPYAQPPTGALRWKAPQKPIPWEGVLKTQKFSKKAMQSLEKSWNTMDKLSEDCLYLNVWKPADLGKDKLPVLFLIHGGRFTQGGTRGPEINGSSMAKKDIIVVTANYRLNIFGFLAHPELSAETAYKGSGNYGLLDLQLALEWVKNNIAVFGGDPNRITLAGESAGAYAIRTFITSPLTKNLVVGAIGSSGGGLTTPSLEWAEKNGIQTLEYLGYKSVEELRKASTSDIIKIYKNKSLSKAHMFNTDNYLIREASKTVYKEKKQADIPLLIGWNSAEREAERFLKGANYTQDYFISTVKETWPKHHKKILNMYSHETQAEVRRSATDLSSMRTVLNTWKWFNAHLTYSTKPVYRYVFSKIPPPAKTVDLSKYTPPLGPKHAADIPYAWGNLDKIKSHNYTKEDYEVSVLMQEYLANFIKTGNPNGEGLPEWPAVKPNSEPPMIMNFDTETMLIPASNDFKLRYMDEEQITFKRK